MPYAGVGVVHSLCLEPSPTCGTGGITKEVGGRGPEIDAVFVIYK